MILLSLLLGCHRTEETDPPVDTATQPAVSEADVAAIIASAQADLVASDATAAQIAVWRDGEIVLELQIGSADPDGDLAFGPDTLFQIGSDTKKMTALLVLQQDAAGELSLQDTVAQAIPGMTLDAAPGWRDAATLHDLLSHQSGIYDYTPWDDDPGDEVLRERALGAFANQGWQMCPPGTTWNYANPGFSLAGLAAETASTRPYATMLSTDLFAPLGMTRTFARKTEVESAGDYAIGSGYTGWSDDPFDPLFASGTWQVGTAEMSAVADNGFTRPAGLVWSTATDMARFGAFFVDGDDAVLDDARRALATTPQVRLYPSFDAQSYGYGWMIYEGITLEDGHYDIPVWAHGGNTLAFTSNSWVLPEQRLSISILTNGYGDDLTPTVVEIVRRLAELPAPVPPPDLPTAETPHDQLVGRYHDPYLGDLIVTEADGKLEIDVPLLKDAGVTVGPTLRLALTDVYTVRVGAETYDLTFVADDDGVYRYLRNRLFVGTRQDGFGPPSPPDRSDEARVAFALRVAEARGTQALAPWGQLEAR